MSIKWEHKAALRPRRESGTAYSGGESRYVFKRDKNHMQNPKFGELHQFHDGEGAAVTYSLLLLLLLMLMLSKTVSYATTTRW